MNSVLCGAVRLSALALFPGLVACLAIRAGAQEEAPYKTHFRVINVHRHCPLATEAAVRAELEVDERVGISTVIILDGGAAPGNLEAWRKLKAKYPGRLAVFWKLSFAGIERPGFFQDIVRNLQHAADIGVEGVKVWKDLGMYVRDGSGALLKADDERLDAFWDLCGALGLPVLWHVADPKEYWYPLTYNSFHYGVRQEKDQFYLDPKMPTWEELMRQRDAVLKKHPKTTFIGAHMGSMSFDLKQLGETLERYPNFNVDTAARLRIIGRLNPPAVRDFFTKYQDRILFGTDDMVLAKGRTPPKSANISIYPTADPPYLFIDPADTDAVKGWQKRAASDYGFYFQYFETSRTDLPDPNHSGGPWLRIAGVELPQEVLEKLYHGNAERLIPGLRK